MSNLLQYSTSPYSKHASGAGTLLQPYLNKHSSVKRGAHTPVIPSTVPYLTVTSVKLSCRGESPSTKRCN